MANTGFVIAGAGANVDRAGNNAWGTPENITADDASATSTTVPTDYLVTSSYGFNVPLDSTIDGIIVRTQGFETGAGSSSYVLQLNSDTTPTLIGDVSATVTVSGGTVTDRDSGSSTDTWNASPTPTLINSSGFGATLWSTDTVNTLFFDCMWIDVYYTLVPHTPTPDSTEYTFTGYDLTVGVTDHKSFTPDVAASTITGYDFTVDVPAEGINIPIDAGSVAFTQYDSFLALTMDAGAGSVSTQGYDTSLDSASYIASYELTGAGSSPTVDQTFIIGIDAGSITATTYDLGTGSDINVNIDLGTLSLSTYNYAIEYTISVETGAIISASYIPGYDISYDIGAGTITVAGYEPVVLSAISIGVPVGSIAITPFAIFSNIPIDIGVGSVSATGYVPLVEFFRYIYISLGDAAINNYSGYFRPVFSRTISRMRSGRRRA